jgi:spore coat protein U-like protein
VFTTTSRKAALIIGAIGAATIATPALAGTANSNLSVNATVTANCTVSTTALNFGSIDTLSASAVDGTGGVSVTCTNGSGWTASADAGSGSGATLASRRMTSGGNVLNYSLFTNAGRTTVWGDGTGGTGTVGNTGTGSAQSFTVYGRIPGGQSSAAAGTYADTVSITISY